MSDINEIHCADCGKFILTEEKESACGNIKCVAGSYTNGYYYGLNNSDELFIKELNKYYIVSKYPAEEIEYIPY